MFDRFQTLYNNSQPHAIRCNRVCKQTQNVTSTCSRVGGKMFLPGCPGGLERSPSGAAQQKTLLLNIQQCWELLASTMLRPFARSFTILVSKSLHQRHSKLICFLLIFSLLFRIRFSTLFPLLLGSIK